MATAVSTIPKAVATGRLNVVTQAIVTRVDVDEKSGRVRGVVYLKGGEEYLQPADVVLLAGYTYENVRLLLLSKSKPFPNGLANNGGQVGRHYMSHHTGATLAALFQTLPGAGFVVNGATPAKNSALTSAGAELRLANGVALIGKFDGEFASHSSTYAGTGTVRYTW